MYRNDSLTLLGKVIPYNPSKWNDSAKSLCRINRQVDSEASKITSGVGFLIMDKSETPAIKIARHLKKKKINSTVSDKKVPIQNLIVFLAMTTGNTEFLISS